MTTSQAQVVPTKHIHHDIICAWAATGAKIEYFSQTDQKWYPTDNPLWCKTTKYRVKPAPVIDAVKKGELT